MENIQNPDTIGQLQYPLHNIQVWSLIQRVLTHSDYWVETMSMTKMPKWRAQLVVLERHQP